VFQTRTPWSRGIITSVAALWNNLPDRMSAIATLRRLSTHSHCTAWVTNESQPCVRLGADVHILVESQMRKVTNQGLPWGRKHSLSVDSLLIDSSLRPLRLPFSPTVHTADIFT
jgi:hypothetical protein